MSADTTEQNAANGEGLRERYLPVSRKELRRRREAELAAQRQAQEAASDEPQQPSEDDPGQPESEVPDPAAVSSPIEASVPDPVHEEDAEDELSRTVKATFASESDELPEEPDAELSGESDVEPAEIETAEPAVLPEPEPELARPEEEIADADDVFHVDEEDATQVITRITDLSEEESEAAESETQLVHNSDDAEPAGADTEEPESDSEHLPESRRVRRMLRETQSIPPLSPELLAELDATNAEIAQVDDPTAVNPDLLKRQQALAAKAMQANQERMRKEHAKAEKDRRRRSRERPESQILTEKMVRDTLEQDPEDMQYATGQIEPVHAQGAHGLDLNKMIDATSRQADRQRILTWTVIVMTILLLAAIASVIYFVAL